jgi:hypothetical protein
VHVLLGTDTRHDLARRRHVRSFVHSAYVSYGTHIRDLSDQTGRTDIPLTQRGEEQIKSKAPYLVGDGSRSK